MNIPPTIVHAAADLHRHALLSEAVDDRRTTPISRSTKGKGPGRTCRSTIAWVARVVSRIIDDFEPGSGARPRPLSRRTG